MAGQVGRNFLAAAASTFWVALMNLLFVPIYLRYLGDEGFGLVGLLATASSLLAILDGGLSVAAARELARATADTERDHFDSRSLVFSLEWVYWLGAGFLGVLLVLATPWLSNHWLRPDKLSSSEVQQAMWLLSLVLVLQWPVYLYQSCLAALQRQTELAYLNIVSSTLKGLGSVLILIWVSPSLKAFFIWQALSAAVTATLQRVILWRHMPSGRRPVFRTQLITQLAQFGTQVGVLNIISTLCVYSDKAVLSRLLPLAQFGQYMLAWTIASQFYRIVLALYSAIQPRFSQLLEAGDEKLLRSTFGWTCRILSLVLIPAAMTVAWENKQLVWLWTQDQALAVAIEPLVFWITLSVLCNSLVYPIYALQVANGNVRLSLINSMILLPGLLTTYWILGPSGGALPLCLAQAVWQFFSLLVLGNYCLDLYLKGEKWRWFGTWLAPLAVSGLFLAAWHRIVPASSTILGNVLTIASLYLVVSALSWLISGVFQQPRQAEVKSCLGPPAQG